MTSLYPDNYTAYKVSKVVDYDTTLAPKMGVRDLFGNNVPNDTFCKIVHDGKKLYVLFKSWYSGTLEPTFHVHGNKVFRDDCVEIFIGNRERYFELDVSAFNVLFEAVITNDGKSLDIDEQKGLTKTTATIFDGYYEVTYEIELDSLTQFGDLYFNLFRVEMVGGARTSRSMSKTDCLSHHETRAFIPLKIEK